MISEYPGRGENMLKRLSRGKLRALKLSAGIRSYGMRRAVVIGPGHRITHSDRKTGWAECEVLYVYSMITCGMSGRIIVWAGWAFIAAASGDNKSSNDCDG